MIQGLDQKSQSVLERLMIEPLKSMGCHVWVFGSRARGDYSEFSDIDLLFEKPNGVTLPVGFLSELRESLEESNLIYKVDLVDIDELAKSYEAGVKRDRIPL